MASLVFDLLFRDHGVRRGLGEVGDETDRARQRAERFSAATAAGAAIAAAAIFKFGSDSVKAYVEAEQSSLKLQQAFEKFPALADTNQAALQELNGELAKKVKFDDDATSSGQAVLANFKLTGTQITQLTPLMQDYAAKTGKDLPAAATVLGKAMMGNGKALKGIGINFKDTGSTAGNFEQIMGGLRTQVGGFAEAEGKTAAGQAAILSNQFGELQETVGEKLLPALIKASEGGLAFLAVIEQNMDVLQPATIAVVGFGVAVWTVRKALVAVAAAQSAWTAAMAAATWATSIQGMIQIASAARLAAASMSVFGVAVAAVWADEKLRQWSMANVEVSKLAQGMKDVSGQGKLSGAEIELFSNKAQLFGNKVDTTAEALQKFGVSAHDALDKGWSARIARWDDMGKGQKSFEDRTRKLDTAFAAMVTGGNIDGAAKQIKLYEDAAVKAGLPVASLRKMFPQYTAAVAASKPPVDAATAATQKHKRALEEDREALLKNARALLRNRGSQNDYEASIDDATQALKDNGKTLDVHTAKGRTNRAALDRVASSTLEWRDAATAAGASQKRQTAITEAGREELVRMGRRFGLSKKAAQDYAREVLGIPKRVTSTISLALKNNIPRTLYGVRIGGGGRGGVTFTGATGGPVRGAGTGTSDSISARLSHGEHVWTAREVVAAGGHAAVLAMRRSVRGPGFAAGGPVFSARAFARGEGELASGTSSRLADRIAKIASAAIGFNPSLNGALNFARAQVGKPYIWGGVGPRGYDCSGFMSALLNVVQGRSPYSRRFATGSFPSAGFVSGPGSFMIGSRRGNPGHMAGTINGVNVESAGSTGPRVGRSARGARSSMFTGLYHLRGYAKGGPVVGDGPYDLLDPAGQDYLGDRVRKMFLADRGGLIRSGEAAINRSGYPERMLSPMQTRSFDRLTRVLDRRSLTGAPASTPTGVTAQQISDTLIRALGRGDLRVVLDGQVLGRVQGRQADLLGRAG
jgi:hypothetical protein